MTDSITYYARLTQKGRVALLVQQIIDQLETLQSTLSKPDSVRVVADQIREWKMIQAENGLELRETEAAG